MMYWYISASHLKSQAMITTKKIATVLAQAEDEKMLRHLLQDILTPAEIKDISERIQIVEALLKGKTQREVAHKLGVSISKVSRGSQLLQYGKGALSKVLNIL